MSFANPRAAALAVLSLTLSAAAAPLRPYSDHGTGVSFLYPATWLLNADDDAATAKLRIVDLSQPGAVVQLEGNFAGTGPYKGTDFEAGAFAYVILPRESEAQCLATLNNIAEGGERPSTLTWKGHAAARLDGTYTVAGTDDTHAIVATYRPGRCFLFETVLVSKSVGGPIHPLPPARWRSLRAGFEAVLQSVRIQPAPVP